MKQTAHYQHWKIDQDQQGIVWVTFDRQDSKVNTLGKEVLEELKNVVNNIPPTAKGVVFQSGKSTGFIAGADITEFENITSEKEALDFVARAKETFNSIEKLR